MIFTINSETFIKKIAIANNIVSKNNFNPLLSCIYLKTEDNILIIKSTNLEIFFEGNIPIKSEVNGEVYIKGEIISKVLHVFSKNINNLLIEKIDNILKISDKDNSKNYIELELFNNEEKSFVSMPQTKNKGTEKDNKGIEIDSSVFIKCIKAVNFCTAKTEIQPQISGVYIYNKENNLYFVGTDSFRLAEKVIYFENDNIFSIIIPNTNIQMLLNCLTEDNKINIETYEDGIIITNKEDIYAIRTSNNTYPDYRQLFPKEFNRIIKCNKDTLLDTVQIASFITDYNNKHFNINVLEEWININTDNKNIGKINKDIKIENVLLKEKELKVTYNPDYFIEGVNKTQNNEIELSWTDERKPLFIKDTKDDSFTYLIMPRFR